MFQEESIQLPFHIKDADGNIIFRDALTFATVSEFRNTSEAEREAMQQQRYENWQAAIQYAKDHPEEPVAPEGE